MSDLPTSVIHKTRGYNKDENKELGYKQPLSKKKIDAAENKHNAKVKKLERENFCIPIVFGGMSTV